MLPANIKISVETFFMCATFIEIAICTLRINLWKKQSKRKIFWMKKKKTFDFGWTKKKERKKILKKIVRQKCWQKFDKWQESKTIEKIERKIEKEAAIEIKKYLWKGIFHFDVMLFLFQFSFFYYLWKAIGIELLLWVKRFMHYVCSMNMILKVSFS